MAVGDNTYQSLEPLGRAGAACATLGERLGLSSATARALYLGEGFSALDESQSLYLYGRPDGRPGDTRPTINHVQGTLNTFTALANRTPATITVKASSAIEDGPWILTKPFTFHAPVDPNTGQPAVNPNTGMPYVDVPLQPFEPIPEEIVDLVPSSRRICINSESACKWQQINFDVKRREIDLDATIRDMVFRKQIHGWPMGLVEWDPIGQVPVVDIYEPQQWFPDPIKSDVAKMNYVRLDIPTDTEEAKRRYPQIAKFIDANGSRTIHYETGSQGYSSVYEVTFETPMVTLVHVWLRNQEAPMTLDEALSTGMAAWKEQGDGQDAQAGAVDGEPGAQALPPQEGLEAPGGDVGGAGGATGEELPGSAQAGGPADSLNPPVRQLVHTATGEDITNSFGPDGNPSEDPHTNHPKKLVTRHWVQIRGVVAPGSDEECQWPDINVFMDRNVPITGRPFSQPETERLRSPQMSLNNVHEAMVDHTAFFHAPTFCIMADIVEDLDPDLVNGNIRPGKTYIIKSDGTPQDDIRRKIFAIEPPPMPPAIPTLKADISNEYQIVAGNPSVNQGTPPPGVNSGVAIAHLQAESQAASGFKSMYSEVAIRRIAMLINHALVHWMSVDEIMRINRSLPRPIVEKYMLPFVRSCLLDFDVELATGAGQIRAQKEAQVREDFKAELIDAETAQEKLDYDADEIKRRQKELREELAREQAEAQASAAPKGPPAPSESMGIAIKFETLTPDVQAAVLQKAGIQVQPGMAATLPPEPKSPPAGGKPKPMEAV